VIQNGEIQKFFKENSLELSQKELFGFIKAVNDVMFLRHATLMMDFPGFVQLIIQTTIYVYRKGRVPGVSAKQALTMMYAQMVYGFLKIISQQAAKRNET
jgi:hypothetical protein